MPRTIDVDACALDATAAAAEHVAARHRRHRCVDASRQAMHRRSWPCSVARATRVATRSGARRAALGEAEPTLRRGCSPRTPRSTRAARRLSGDWPAHWREGLHHDFETTRLLVQPPGGIFTRRLAQLDGRLAARRAGRRHPGHAAPGLCRPGACPARGAQHVSRRAAAERAVRLRGGEYNMVAADGSRCGTSPAWCLPFLNLRAAVPAHARPRLAGAALPVRRAPTSTGGCANRVDADGWVVYKCTWESGEDGNPRLDPTGSGDADIARRGRARSSCRRRMAHAAGVLAFFAARARPADDVPRWRQLEADYRERTRAAVRSADGPLSRLAHRRAAVPASRARAAVLGHRRRAATRAQSLTPLLHRRAAGRRRGLAPRLPALDAVAVVDLVAGRVGRRRRPVRGVGALAFDTIDRVYRVTTRRELGSLARPMPGCVARVLARGLAHLRRQRRLWLGRDHRQPADSPPVRLQGVARHRRLGRSSSRPRLPDRSAARWAHATASVDLNYRGLVVRPGYTVVPTAAGRARPGRRPTRAGRRRTGRRRLRQRRAHDTHTIRAAHGGTPAPQIGELARTICAADAGAVLGNPRLRADARPDDRALWRQHRVRRGDGPNAGTFFIFDSGTGIRELGLHLARQGGPVVGPPDARPHPLGPHLGLSVLLARRSCRAIAWSSTARAISTARCATCSPGRCTTPISRCRSATCAPTSSSASSRKARSSIDDARRAHPLSEPHRRLHGLSRRGRRRLGRLRHRPRAVRPGRRRPDADRRSVAAARRPFTAATGG